MNPTTHMAIPDLLQAGLDAVAQGDRERGRALLLEVVERDDQNVAAWLALGQAMDDPADRRTALENVLTLEPDHAEARRRLEALEAPPAPGDDLERWQHLIAESPREIEDDLDDPYLCVYCGRLTGERDRRCPHCGRGLYRRVERSEGSIYLQRTRALLAFAMGFGVLGFIGPGLGYIAANTPGQTVFTSLYEIAALRLITGEFIHFNSVTAQWLISGLLARQAILLALLVGIGQRWRIAFYGATVLLLLDAAAQIGLMFTPGISPVAGVGNVIMALVVLMALYTADREFTIEQERLLNKPDSKAHTAVEYYKLGHTYRKQGMWALAVAQWRRAVGLAPREALYYRDLGLGYAQIKRYERSLRTLEEAHHQQPGDAEIADILSIVRQQAAPAASPAAGRSSTGGAPDSNSV